jgi:hypothetical protein
MVLPSISKLGKLQKRDEHRRYSCEGMDICGFDYQAGDTGHGEGVKHGLHDLP